MGQLTRRRLLQGAAVAAVATPLTVLTPDPAAAAARLTRASFTPYKNGQFLVGAAARRTALRLTAIEDLDVHNKGHQRRFRLLLKATGGAALRQGTHTLRHPKLGSIAVFLVPTGTKGTYAAVFNGL